MKEGYLQKQGQLLKGWKKRWFVCDGRTLSYFHTNLDKTPSAIIPLKTATVQDGGTSERWNGPRIYVTDTISGVVYCVSGEDSTSVLQWLVILQRAVQRICDAKAEHTNAPLRQKSHSVPADLKATDTAFGGSLRRPTASVSASNVLSNSTASSKRSKSTSHVTSKPVNLSTTLRLENDLAVAKALLGTLLFQHSRFHVMSNVHHHPNLRIGFVTDPVTGKAYLRGSIVLDVVPALALRLLLDPQKRPEWDVHFPLASHVASYGGATALLHLASTSSVPFMPAAEYVTLLVVVACAAVAALAMSSQSLMHAANAAVVGALLGSLLVITVSPQTLWRHAVQRRDLLLLRHVFEAQSSANSVTLSTNDAMVVAELSVVNELKPVTQSTIRGRVSISGWLVQSLGTDATLVTHVVDNVNLNGWLPAAVSERVARGRLSKCLPALASFVRHAQTQGSHCGYHDDLFDIDATAVIDEEEDEDDATDSNDLLAPILPLDPPHVGPSALGFPPRQYMQAVVRNPAGGVTLTDKDVAKKQNGVVMEVIKTMGTKLLDGKSAVSLSLPVRIFEARTMLDRLVDFYMYAPNYLSAASDATDAVERFKLTMAFAVAGWHHAMGCAKPFNPIVGETLQAAFVDGATVHCEQAASSPLPISYAQVVHPKYAVWSRAVVNVAMHTNTFTQMQNGPVVVAFPDGGRVELALPSMRVSGLLWGDRVLDLVGSITFRDEANDLVCDLKLNFDEHKGLFASNKAPTDCFRGTIMQHGDSVCDVTGSWLDELRAGDHVLWSFERDACAPLVRVPDDQVLPSDSRHRPDLRALATYDLDEAQDRKFQVEKLQRSDRAFRKDGRRPTHWTFAAS
ncbi:hypothetical protein DYB37_002564 [Aphanomyces astaci]|uniref:PH domain-containing protein n=1 Tax=Aphanomyces astaci TaxID=112090 RepID=A0A418FAB6_APHAT|nr:hypothetical protein DYB37_002564 [Aphanomyces astaci]